MFFGLRALGVHVYELRKLMRESNIFFNISFKFAFGYSYNPNRKVYCNYKQRTFKPKLFWRRLLFSKSGYIGRKGKNRKGK